MPRNHGLKLSWALAILAGVSGNAARVSALASSTGQSPTCVPSKRTAVVSSWSPRCLEFARPALKLRGGGGGGEDLGSPRPPKDPIAAAAASANPRQVSELSGGALVASAKPLILLVAVWYISSVFAITTSKLSMQVAPVPFTLCLCQFLVATSISRGVLALSPAPEAAPEPLQLEASSVWKVAACYTFGFMLTNVAFSLSSAPFVETVKSSEPITTVVLAFFLLGERETPKSLACLLFVIVGVALASADDMTFSLPAFCAVQLCNLGFSGRSVLVKQLKQNFPQAAVSKSMIELFYHVHRLGLGLLVPVVLLAERSTLMNLTPEVATKLAATMAVNGVFYSIYNLFSFFTLARVPTSVHAVLNVFRRVVVILITAAFFKVPMSALNLAGVTMAVGGILLFKAVKQQQQQLPAATSTPPAFSGMPPAPPPPSPPPVAAPISSDEVVEPPAAVEDIVAPAADVSQTTAPAAPVTPDAEVDDSAANEAPSPNGESGDEPAAAA